MVDEGQAIHYAAVARGIPVYGSDGVKIGKVDEVVDNYREHILDGIVIDTAAGGLRFVDGPEVARTAERAVTLTITASEADALPRPERGPKVFRPRHGRLSRLLGGWRRE
jgi:sporulation protein YlmC with PRC-barrel domain